MLGFVEHGRIVIAQNLAAAVDEIGLFGIQRLTGDVVGNCNQSYGF